MGPQRVHSQPDVHTAKAALGSSVNHEQNIRRRLIGTQYIETVLHMYIGNRALLYVQQRGEEWDVDLENLDFKITWTGVFQRTPLSRAAIKSLRSRESNIVDSSQADTQRDRQTDRERHVQRDWR